MNPLRIGLSLGMLLGLVPAASSQTNIGDVGCVLGDQSSFQTALQGAAVLFESATGADWESQGLSVEIGTLRDGSLAFTTFSSDWSTGSITIDLDNVALALAVYGSGSCSTSNCADIIAAILIHEWIHKLDEDPLPVELCEEMNAFIFSGQLICHDLIPVLLSQGLPAEGPCLLYKWMQDGVRIELNASPPPPCDEDMLDCDECD